MHNNNNNNNNNNKNDNVYGAVIMASHFESSRGPYDEYETAPRPKKFVVSGNMAKKLGR